MPPKRHQENIMYISFIYAFISLLLIVSALVMSHFALQSGNGFTIKQLLTLWIIIGIAIVIADKIRIRIHDKRIEKKMNALVTEEYTQSPEWKQANTRYADAHPLKTVSKSGIRTLISGFYTFSPINMTCAAAAGVVMAGYFSIINYKSVPFYHTASLFLIIFTVASTVLLIVIRKFTTVPYRAWLKAMINQNPDFYAELQKRFDNAKYVKTGESLLFLGKDSVLMCNLLGIAEIPYANIAGVARTVLSCPQYINLTSHTGTGKDYYCGLKCKTGIVTDIIPSGSPVSSLWYQEVKYKIKIATNVIHSGSSGSSPWSKVSRQIITKGGANEPLISDLDQISAFFPLNEHQTDMFIREISKKLDNISIPDEYEVMKLTEEYNPNPVGNFDVSDYFIR